MPFPQKRISSLFAANLPNWIKDNTSYQNLIAFLRAYYQFLEQDTELIGQTYNLLSYRDVDTTLDQFVSEHLFGCFLAGIPQTVLADPRLLIKHIKEFYVSRGTVESYQFLFQILFNDSISIYYPKSDLFRLSNNVWNVNTVLRSTSNNDTFLMIGRYIVGVSSGARAAVENVIQLQYGADVVSEISISQIDGIFQGGELISCLTASGSTITETLYTIANAVSIVDPGNKYKAGEFFTIPNEINPNGNVLVKVSSVGNYIQGVPQEIILESVVTFGASAVYHKAKYHEVGVMYHANMIGYMDQIPADPGQIQLEASSSSVNGFYDGMQLEIIRGYSIPNDVYTITDYSGTTNVATINGPWTHLPNITTNQYQIDLAQVKSVQLIDFGINFPSGDTFTLIGSGDGTAEIVITCGAMASYQGQFKNSESFLSSTKKLQDSFLYQAYSYVIQASEAISQYRDVVKELLHSAGTIMFGNVDSFLNAVIGPSYRTFEYNKNFFAPYPGYTPNYLTALLEEETLSFNVGSSAMYHRARYHNHATQYAYVDPALSYTGILEPNASQVPFIGYGNSALYHKVYYHQAQVTYHDSDFKIPNLSDYPLYGNTQLFIFDDLNVGDISAKPFTTFKNLPDTYVELSFTTGS